MFFLFDFSNMGSCKCKQLVTHMLTAVSLLIAQRWKSEELPNIGERLAKVQYLCLLNKLSAMCKLQTGDAHVLEKKLNYNGHFLRPQDVQNV